MKYFNLFIVVLFSLLIVSCVDDQQLNYRGVVYSYTIENTPDSIMSADAHDLILDVSAKDLRDEKYNWSIMTTNVLSVDPTTKKAYAMTYPNDNITCIKGDTLYFQNWLKVYKTWKDGKYKLRVEMKENTSDSIRGCMLSVGRLENNKKSNILSYEGKIEIIQDYKRDNDESFAVNIRFKGKLHTSQATLDSNGNLVYQDNFHSLS